jgi:hypothetical protein
MKKSISFAEYTGIEKYLSVIAIEDFIAFNIIEMATGDQARFLEILQEIINIYNKRLEEVETDMFTRFTDDFVLRSLKIEIQ